MLTIESCEREIREVHRFFADWFNGRLEETDCQFSRFGGVLDDAFTITSPDGITHDRNKIITAVRGLYNQMIDMQIHIEDVHSIVRTTDTAVLRYEEWQVRSGEQTRRISMVVFVADEKTPNGVCWRHVQETWLPVI